MPQASSAAKRSGRFLISVSRSPELIIQSAARERLIEKRARR